MQITRVDEWVREVWTTVDQLEIIRKALADYQPEDVSEQGLKSYMLIRLNAELITTG